MIEYLSPNTNKPLHLGHIRNGVLGMAISRLLESVGYKVIKANLINDRGIHICQSMLAWKKWGNAERRNQPAQKDTILSARVVCPLSLRIQLKIRRENGEALEKESREMLQKWGSRRFGK